MAVLTQDAVIRFRRPEHEKRDVFNLDTSTAQTIYKGQPMLIDKSIDTLYARGYIDNATPALATGDVFLGIAAGSVAVTLGQTELQTQTELTIVVSGPVGFKSSVLTDADIGKDIYMSDNNTLTLTTTNNLLIGKLERVQDGFAFVNINPTGTPALNV